MSQIGLPADQVRVAVAIYKRLLQQDGINFYVRATAALRVGSGTRDDIGFLLQFVVSNARGRQGRICVVYVYKRC